VIIDQGFCLQENIQEGTMRYVNRSMVVLVFMTALLLGACAPKTAAVTKIEPAKIEEIAGSEFKRVILTEKAAERIGIATETVRDEQVTRVRRVGGKVTASPPGSIPDTGASSTAGDSSRVWVQVRLSESDLSMVDRSRPVRVLPITDDDEDEDEDEDGLEAEPDEGLNDDDEEDAASNSAGGQAEGALYYVVDNSNQSLTPGQGVFVELSISDSAAQRLVIPYAAVVYGLEGETWVYTNPEPLVYIREPIGIDYIEGDTVVLSEGPASGTPVVVIGAAELFGAETGVSK
jgi:hypothetical protein